MGACPSDLAGPTPGPAPDLAKAANDASIKGQIKEQIAEFKDLADKITTTTIDAGTLLDKLGPDTRIPPSTRRPVSNTVSQIVDDMGVENDKFKVQQSTIVNVSSKLALSNTSPLSDKELENLLKEANDAVSSARAVLPILEAKLAKIRAIDAYVSGTSSAPPPSGPVLDLASLSIASIDTYLTAKYSPIGSADNMRVNGTIGTRPPFNVFSKYIFGNYETITTSGNKNDCLVHAILGGVSSVFRKLTDAQKDEFADYFRRTVLPKTSLYIGKSVDITRLTGTDLLTDVDVGNIKDILKISILSFESAVSGVIGNPGVADFFREGLPEVYMIFNPGNAHFETVRVNRTSSYTIPIDTARDIKKVIIEDTIKSAYAGATSPDTFIGLEKEGFVLPTNTSDVALFQTAIADEIEAAKRRLAGTTAPVTPSAVPPRRVGRADVPPPKPWNRSTEYIKGDRIIVDGRVYEYIGEDNKTGILPGVVTSWKPVTGNFIPPRPVTGGPATRRKRRGGNDPVKYTPLTPENIKKDVELSVSKSPGVSETVKKLQEKKGGRRRTFRKKKTLRQLEKKLDELKEIIYRSS